MYVSPLYQRFKEEGVCLDQIFSHDRIYICDVTNNGFCLVIDDARKNLIAMPANITAMDNLA